jgi:hypothetical protein
MVDPTGATAVPTARGSRLSNPDNSIKTDNFEWFLESYIGKRVGKKATRMLESEHQSVIARGNPLTAIRRPG